MGWMFLASVLLLCLCAAGLPLPQGGGSSGGSAGVGGAVGAGGAHGQPQAGSPSTPGPGGGSSLGPIGGGTSGSGTAAAGGGSSGLGITGSSTGGGAGGGAAGGGSGSFTAHSAGPTRRGRGWRDWRRGDPTLIKGLWKSKGPLDSLGKAEVYIILALLIGFVTVVVGCWMSDNCWSPEPEGVVTLA